MVYVNGDSHTAAAEAVNQHAFAEDDEDLGYLGRLPHPANLAVSWGRVLADLLKATFKCDAESASSNARILRTARAWATAHPARRDHLMIIQWSTWERTEWHIDDRLYQINASGLDHVPESHQNQYRQCIADLDRDCRRRRRRSGRDQRSTAPDRTNREVARPRGLKG